MGSDRVKFCNLCEQNIKPRGWATHRKACKRNMQMRVHDECVAESIRQRKAAVNNPDGSRCRTINVTAADPNILLPNQTQEHLDAWAPTIFLLILLVSALASHPYPDLALVILVILAFPFALYLSLQQSQYIWPDPFSDEAYPCSVPPVD
ncbi:uncharacterized protein EDB93DRAFT_1246727 [Suillus bovinus]|uniref:uncharacterized protein n=1 Tax=Suillus bovinus TaxID=48563 RepID=UPI001B85EAE9|nr:uncharacterized protein EDB93DRAFT_1246727 [Suillus bovinus]KAG2157659.1 hypothetical protein EDB93DRAFT_1246727 [Suillus bovinus]